MKVGTEKYLFNPHIFTVGNIALKQYLPVIRSHKAKVCVGVGHATFTGLKRKINILVFTDKIRNVLL